MSDKDLHFGENYMVNDLSGSTIFIVDRELLRTDVSVGSLGGGEKRGATILHFILAIRYPSTLLYKKAVRKKAGLLDRSL